MEGAASGSVKENQTQPDVDISESNGRENFQLSDDLVLFLNLPLCALMKIPILRKKRCTTSPMIRPKKL